MAGSDPVCPSQLARDSNLELPMIRFDKENIINNFSDPKELSNHVLILWVFGILYHSLSKL